MSGVARFGFCSKLLYFLLILVASVNAECTYTAQPNTTVNSGTTLYDTSVKTVEACKAKCDDDCVAFAFEATSFFPCKIFATLPDESDIDENSVDYTCCTYYYNKTCPDSTTTEATTTAAEETTTSASDPTTATTEAATTAAEETTTSASGSCSMVSVANKALNNSPYLSGVVTATWDTCKALCLWVTECEACSYSATAVCTLHTSTTTVTGGSSGSKHAAKMSSANGQQCHFMENEETIGTSSSSFSVNLQDPVTTSCQLMCNNAISCQALTVIDNRCSVFTSVGSTQTQSGSSYYRKACTGTDPSTLTLTNVCDSAESVQLSKLLGVWLFVISTAMI